MKMERMFVNFILGNQEFAAPIEAISEVINLSELYPVPKAPDYLLGVMSLRGDVISVIDLAKKLGVKRKDNEKDNKKDNKDNEDVYQPSQKNQSEEERRLKDNSEEKRKDSEEDKQDNRSPNGATDNGYADDILMDEEEDTRKMLVVGINSIKVGFLVDNIKGILKIKEENIAPPHNIIDVKEEFLQGVANLDDGRIIFIIDVKKVLSKKEVQLQEKIQVQHSEK